MLLAKGLQDAEEFLDLGVYGIYLVPQEQAYVQQHLVVAGTAGMDLFAHFSEFAGEQQFYLRMDVFHIVFQAEFACLYAGGNLFQRLCQNGEFICVQQAYALQHLDMRQRTLHVVTCQTQVQDAVVPNSERFYHIGCGSAFIPECCHKMCGLVVCKCR